MKNGKWQGRKATQAESGIVQSSLLDSLPEALYWLRTPQSGVLSGQWPLAMHEGRKEMHAYRTFANAMETLSLSLRAHSVTYRERSPSRVGGWLVTSFPERGEGAPRRGQPGTTALPGPQCWAPPRAPAMCRDTPRPGGLALGSLMGPVRHTLQCRGPARGVGRSRGGQ